MRRGKLTPEDLEIATLFKRWLEATYQGTAVKFADCKCAKTECVGHVVVAARGCVRRIWPETKM